jgi:predicted ATPase
MDRSRQLAVLAEVYTLNDQPEEGLAVLAEALQHVEKTGGRYYEAEMYRLQGELLLHVERGMRNDEQKTKKRGHITPPIHHSSFIIHRSGEAEACFQKAMEIARRQQAKSLELRATVSLARLWQQQGKKDDAYSMLADIYTWFTEGFDTKDLQEAKALLEELT